MKPQFLAVNLYLQEEATLHKDKEQNRKKDLHRTHVEIARGAYEKSRLKFIFDNFVSHAKTSST